MSTESQATGCVNHSTKKRITVDSAKRAGLTEYYFSRNGKVSPKEASELFSIGFENCRKLLRKLHKGEQIVERPTKRKHSSKLLPVHDSIIEKLILDNPKISNQAIANFLRSFKQCPINVSRSTIRRHRQQYLNTDDSTQVSTEEIPFDNQPFDLDSFSYEFGTMNEYEDFSSSLCLLPFDGGLEEKWDF